MEERGSPLRKRGVFLKTGDFPGKRIISARVSTAGRFAESQGRAFLRDEGRERGAPLAGRWEERRAEKGPKGEREATIYSSSRSISDGSRRVLTRTERLFSLSSDSVVPRLFRPPRPSPVLRREKRVTLRNDQLCSYECK